MKKKKKKNFLKVFKERWYQSHENFNFEGRKINFQGWSRTMGIIFQRKFQISKKKKNSKDYTNQSRFSF